MKTYTIDNQTNNITVHATAQDAEAVPNAERFPSATALARLAANWPTARLADIWNSLPGVTPVKKFRDRATGVSRIWTAIQTLDAAVAKEPKPASARQGSKTDLVLGLIKRPDGASLKEIMQATNWQAHSVRGFISGTLGKKMNLTVISTRSSDGDRIYSLKG